MSAPVTSQPLAYKSSNGEFKHGLFSCFGDLGTSCKVCWCPCLVHKSTQEGMGRDNGGTCLLLSCASCFFPAGWLAISCIQRQELRERHGIEGGMIGDFLAVFCCLCCAMVQHDREVNQNE
ncbi:Oidioi.mRNA.OKI2018_I69.chr1.g2494.t1.cds [Oikopleura dioica]|uniref:Oidioi.mRNA.OKI2018_I69.chr1.g2494.t1.cds n=1 Tax=Oikopleura dioica TaxID=34765 RepID=A0ABN7SUR7_OIKDI|nr:Oidioi.mRNA.OKI2018_I69.chr1.g2494.t1.cds [Oikopleura dioica]